MHLESVRNDPTFTLALDRASRMLDMPVGRAGLPFDLAEEIWNVHCLCDRIGSALLSRQTLVLMVYQWQKNNPTWRDMPTWGSVVSQEAKYKSQN